MSEERLQVSEIYASIQGESRFAGLPCVFIRLTGCPLRCVWCDTEHAFHGGKSMTVGNVLDEAVRLGIGLVEVTGGEPLAQPNCLPLLRELAATGRTVLLETSGAFSIRGVPAEVVKILDVKCPGSGEAHRNLEENYAALTERDELKFVLADRADFDWAMDFVSRRPEFTSSQILFSPAFGALHPKTLAEWMLETRAPARLQLQIHKYIWSPEATGV